MSPNRIHHINFVVRDLEEAVDRYERMLGVDPFEVIDHPARSAQVARTRIGDSWLVLVCPRDPESVPGQHLANNGEGFFLLSLGYDDIGSQLEHLEAGGLQPIDAEPRDGILDWRVADVGNMNGALIQLTHDKPDTR